MKGLGNAQAATVLVGENHADQRVDNFLLRELKGVPRSHVYRVLRSGEVRVNSRRVDATYRLRAGDKVRVPPVRMAVKPAGRPIHTGTEFPVVFEDDALLVIDKPSGVAVHGGSGVNFGVIEQLRAARPQARFLELVHRLDRDTSGLLILAKKRAALVGLHEAFRSGHPEKRYLTLVKGRWTKKRLDVALPLTKYVTREGERRVSVDEAGQDSRTRFELVGHHGDFSLLSASIQTGRTHQIRVQLAHLGYPIAGDDKYGDFDLNKRLARTGLKRMFLHASALAFRHPVTGAPLRLEAPLPPDLRAFLDAPTAHAETV